MVTLRSQEENEQEDQFLRYISTLSGQTVHYFPGSSDSDGAIAQSSIYDLFHRFAIDYVTHSNIDVLSDDLVMIGPGDHLSAVESRSIPRHFEALIRNNEVVFVPQNTMRFDDIARLSNAGATLYCQNTLCLELALLQGVAAERTYLAHRLTVHLAEEHTRPSTLAGNGVLVIGEATFCSVLGSNVDHSVVSAYYHSTQMTSREFCRNAVQGFVSLLQHYDTIMTDRPNIAVLAAALGKSVTLYRDPNDSLGAALDDSLQTRFPTLTIGTEFATLHETALGLRGKQQRQPIHSVGETVQGNMGRSNDTESFHLYEQEITRLKSLLFESQRIAELTSQDQKKEISRLLIQYRTAESRAVRDTLSEEGEATVAAVPDIREPRFVPYRVSKQRLSQLDALWEKRLAEAEQSFEARSAADRERAVNAALEQEAIRTTMRNAEVAVEQQKLRTTTLNAQAGEAAASQMAKSAWQAIAARHAELGRQAGELEHAAGKARSEVVRLASEASDLYANESVMAQAWNTKQDSLAELLKEGEANALALKSAEHASPLGWARRWRKRAQGYETLVSRLAELSAEAEKARHEHNVATEQRRLAEDLALQAEPNASELASAAVVVRGEHTAFEEMIASLEHFSAVAETIRVNDYRRWIDLYDTLTDVDRQAIKARITRLTYKPLISVVMPVYETPLSLLRKAIESVRSQLYEHWELCIADDASPNPDVFELLQGFSAADARIKVVRRDRNGHIAAASNSALALAKGDFVALLDHDDLLAEQALFEIAISLNENSKLDLLFSDEDHIDENEVRSNPYFKSDYNQALMLGHNMINHLGVYRRSLVDEVGGFRVGYEGSQDYDLALRVIDATVPREGSAYPGSALPLAQQFAKSNIFRSREPTVYRERPAGLERSSEPCSSGCGYHGSPDRPIMAFDSVAPDRNRRRLCPSSCQRRIKPRSSAPASTVFSIEQIIRI